MRDDIRIAVRRLCHRRTFTLAVIATIAVTIGGAITVFSVVNGIAMVVGQGVRLAAAGIAIGIGVALVASPLLQSLLYGIARTDASTYLLVSILVAGITLVACWIPALHGARVDPVIAMRAE